MLYCFYGSITWAKVGRFIGQKYPPIRLGSFIPKEVSDGQIAHSLSRCARLGSPATRLLWAVTVMIAVDTNTNTSSAGEVRPRSHRGTQEGEMWVNVLVMHNGLRQQVNSAVAGLAGRHLPTEKVRFARLLVCGLSGRVCAINPRRQALGLARRCTRRRSRSVVHA